MNSQELKTAYMDLYDYMANSGNPANMKAFGKVMTEMYMWFADNKPEAAQEWYEKLEAVRWNNYLTPKEAQAIVDRMQPKAPWSRDVWRNAMQQFGLKTDEQPHYNSCALWVEMNKQYSDHAETLARTIWKKPIGDISVEQMVTGIHALAVDLLKDQDHVYNIRSYFGL